MKMTMILMAMGWLFSTTIAAQEELETTVGADIVSQYIWRGQDLGNAAIQPTLGISYKGLSLAAWGSLGIVDSADTKEFDLTASYTFGGLSISLTDYWFSTGLDPKSRYFNYSSHETNHLFEGSIGYDFGPVSLQWFTNFAGNDGLNADGKRAYSSYMEVNVPFRLVQTDWSLTAGAVPFSTTSYGTNGFSVTNLSLRTTKEIRVTDTFSIPLFAQLSANPCSQKAYLVFGFTMRP